jgi:HK97 family phage major capsid protein
MLTEGKRMPTTQQLREQRANIWDQMQEVYDTASRENREMTAEETAKYDKAEADLDRFEAQIERAEKHDKRATQYDTVDRTGVVPAPRGDDPHTGDPLASNAYEKAFMSFLQNGQAEMEPDEKRILRAGWVDGKDFKAAAGVGTGAAGGFAVPPQFRDVFIETMKWYGPMLDEAERIDTDTGANLQWPTNDDTGNVGAILAENTQVTEQDVTLGTASLDAYMYTSKLVRASYQLLQDRSDFDTWLARKLGERVGRILNQHFTTGTGTAQPDGIVTAATVGVTGSGSLATTGGFAYDNVVDLIEALDPAYGNASDGNGQAPGLKFMLHQTARKALRKLKDSQGRPLWEPSLQAGAADSLLGYPVRINNDMPTLATSSKSVLFGNIRQAYVARIVRELTVLRLTERYADFLQVGFLGFERADGTMQDANAVRVFQTTATA